MRSCTASLQSLRLVPPLPAVPAVQVMLHALEEGEDGLPLWLC